MEVQEFRREAFVSWFLSHPNIQPFLGIDQATFFPLLCIVLTWQQNGNILDWLKYFKTLGLPILVDECVRLKDIAQRSLLYIHSLWHRSYEFYRGSVTSTRMA